ncbi:MAG TPA: TolC family protein [Bacteroidia bacterium]|nr:TolC family protein [Bacteroidia bacterium]
MKKIKIYLLGVFCSWLCQASGQTVSLDSILSAIEKNNPMLKMYEEQINAVENFSKGAKSWMAPTLSTGPWQTPYSMFNEGMWMFTGEQMIPNPAKQRANYFYMKGMGEVEQYGRNAKRNELFALAKTNYYEWVILKKKYDNVLQIDSVLNYIFQVAKNRYTFNKEKLSNVLKTEAELYQIKNMQEMLVYEIQMRNIEINSLMNKNKSDRFEVDTTVLDKHYDNQESDSSAIANSRSDLKQLDATIVLLKLQQDLEKTKRLPDFGISLSHMQSLGVMPNSYSAMGMVTVPITPWASKEYKSNIKGIENNIRAIDYQREAMLNETSGMIASIKTQIKSLRKQIENYKINIIPTYYQSYQSALLSYQQNNEDLFVVLDALRMYKMSNEEMYTIMNTIFQLQVQYEKELEIR